MNELRLFLIDIDGIVQMQSSKFKKLLYFVSNLKKKKRQQYFDQNPFSPENGFLSIKILIVKLKIGKF